LSDLGCGLLILEVTTVRDGTMNLVIGIWEDTEKENNVYRDIKRHRISIINKPNLYIFFNISFDWLDLE